MEVVFIKKFYVEQFEDFEKLGLFVVMESNVVFGIAEIVKLLKIPVK